MSYSDYYLSLSGDVKARYDAKLALIDGVDPYTLSVAEPSAELSLDLSFLPPVTIVDLMNYLILSHSFYTGQQLKAYKSLQAYKFYEAGFVHQVSARKFTGCYLIVGKVMHSQKRREKPLQVWVILLEDRAVSTAHCTCMAGLGEVCSHVAAVLFFLEARPTSDQKACTEMLARWPVPTVKNADMMRIRDMNLAKIVKPISVSASSVQPLEGQEFTYLLTSLQSIGIDPAIARVSEPFATKMMELQKDLPIAYDAYFNEAYVNKSYEEVLKFSKAINIRITDKDINLIEESTRDQSQSMAWFKYRAGRVTASKFKATSKARVEKPPLSLIKGICYPQNAIFYSKQTTYGIRNEKIAIENYLRIFKKYHENVHLKKAGFFISKTHQDLGASPDALISCECHDSGCVEVKCPYLLKELSLDEFVARKSSCLVKKAEDEYVLDKNHSYYYQVQLQMFVTNLKYCDFVVWSKNHVVIDRVDFDEEFCENMIEKSLNFHELVLKPELTSKYFTRQEGFAKITMWCICKSPDDGRPMLQCDSAECDIQWFHFDCMGLLDTPENAWFCDSCK